MSCCWILAGKPGVMGQLDADIRVIHEIQEACYKLFEDHLCTAGRWFVPLFESFRNFQCC